MVTVNFMVIVIVMDMVIDIVIAKLTHLNTDAIQIIVI